MPMNNRYSAQGAMRGYTPPPRPMQSTTQNTPTIPELPFETVPVAPLPGEQCPQCLTPPSVAQPPCPDPLFTLPVGMAFVVIQPWQQPYSPTHALRRGSLFPCLDLPFSPGGAQ